ASSTVFQKVFCTESPTDMPSSSPSEMPSSSPSAMPSSSPSETPSTSPTVNKCFFLRTFGTNPPRTYSD
ncbi:MAG: hypothetical protein CO106_08830, partial [Deltaproteobacteria bacterium CG_4_9_14_3_um_filter_44_9]